MVKKKLKIQTLIFNKGSFPSRRLVKAWILKNGYTIDNRLKKPIMKTDRTFRVRQRNPDWFKKSSFKTKDISKGIKAVVGILK